MEADSPFGRQPEPVKVTIEGHELDVLYWLRHLQLRAEFKGDITQTLTDEVLHKYPKITKSFKIYPRAVND